MTQYTIQQLTSQPEGQTFDRKSIRIAPKDLAVIMVAFANADGGTIAIGIADDGKLEGIDKHPQQVNELLRVPFDYCQPTVKVEPERISFENNEGKADHILLMHVVQSQKVHANQKDEVYYRVGDKSKKLTFDERFVTKAEYPEFVWKELIINAITHRDYCILGTDIQIKMFDDRITVESPGNLPSIVRLDNMRHVHFSRNPLIAQFLKAYKFVREFGEGVDRMYRESQEAGNPEPKYEQVAFMILGTAYSLLYSKENGSDRQLGDSSEKNVTGNVTGNRLLLIIEEMKKNTSITTTDLARIFHVTRRTIHRDIDLLKQQGLLTRIGPDKGGCWQVNEQKEQHEHNI